MNVENLILMNMSDLNIINKGDNEMGNIITDNGYRIELSQKSFKGNFTNNNMDINYICYMKILNSLNLEILSLNMSIQDILVLIDNIIMLIDFNMSQVSIPIRMNNLDFKSYYFYIFRKIDESGCMNNSEDTYISIREIDINSSIEVERCILEFKDDKISDFCDLLYFLFISDLENIDYAIQHYYDFGYLGSDYYSNFD